MNAALVAGGSLVLLLLGYRFYSKFLSQRIFKTHDDNSKTPATMLDDGIDYVPTRKSVLFGHHFSSIAGAAPILGPAIAIVWGWVPALIWIVFGSILMGAVHDYGSLVLSARHGGSSIGVITKDIIGGRTKPLFLTIIFLLVFIVIAVFAYLIANLFILYPGSVIPINFEIVVSLFMGWWVYKRQGNLLVPSLTALVLLYLMVYVGFLYPVSIPEGLWLGGSEVLTWVVILMGYGFIASVLPVWVLLQPRDYINSHQLIVGLIVIYLAIFIAQPSMDAPALNLNVDLNWFPFLFITIACGAISGFHSLVSSGTTSKQLANMKDSRMIGYGAMIGEASLAVAATIAVAAGFSDEAAWHSHYGDFAHASGMGAKLSAFVDGTSGFLAEIGIHATAFDTQGNLYSLSAVFVSVLVISFAATSLDTAVRIQRYVIGEIATGLKVKFIGQNRYVQSGLAVLFSTILILSEGDGSGGLRLWPLFGSTNQLLGALTLLVISVWLFKQKINYLYTLIPMILITLVTLIANYHNVHNYIQEENWMLVPIAVLIAICQFWIIVESIRVFAGGNQGNNYNHPNINID